MDFSVLARDYVELLVNLGYTRANVVGHSTGGMIALHAMILAPEIFSRAVLLNPVSAHGLEVTSEMLTSFLEMSRDREKVKAVLARSIYMDDFSPFFESLVDQACATHPLVWAHILKKLGSVEIAEPLSRVKHPTLILHGKQDPIQPVEGSRELAEILPEGRFELLEHQGHSCHDRESWFICGLGASVSFWLGRTAISFLTYFPSLKVKNLQPLCRNCSRCQAIRRYGLKKVEKETPKRTYE